MKNVDPRLVEMWRSRREWQHSCGHEVGVHVMFPSGEVACTCDGCGCRTDLRGVVDDSKPFEPKTGPVETIEVEYIAPPDVSIRLSHASYIRVCRLIRRDRSLLAAVERSRGGYRNATE
jgi:hypothetical protein